MLRSQALNVGRSLGRGLAIVWAHRVYKDVWKPAICENLHAEQEPDNAVDKFAMRIVKTKQLAIYLTSTCEFCGTLSYVAERYAWK